MVKLSSDCVDDPQQLKKSFLFHLQDGFTPIDVAVQQGHEKVVAALLHHDSRVTIIVSNNVLLIKL